MIAVTTSLVVDTLLKNAQIAFDHFRSGDGDQEMFNHLIFLQRFMAKLPLRHGSWKDYRLIADKVLEELVLIKQRQSRTGKWALTGDAISAIQKMLDTLPAYCNGHLQEQINDTFLAVRDEYNREVKEARRAKRAARLKGIAK